MDGRVEHSVLFSDVTIGEGAAVKDSIIMEGAVVEPGARVEYAIVDRGAFIGAGARVGGPVEDGKLTVLADHVRIGEGAVVAAGMEVTEDIEK